MRSVRRHLALRRPWHRAWHHLRVLLGYVALWRLVALGYLRLGLVAMLLVWLRLTRECLLILGRHAWCLLWGHVPMWVALLGLGRGARARKWSRASLVPLRQRLPSGLRVWLLLWLLWGWRGLAWALHGHPWLLYELGISRDLWGCTIASGNCRWHRVAWS